MPESQPTELERFARALITAQAALLAILRRKRTALTTADEASLTALRVPELQAAQQLQVLVTWRARLLQEANRDRRRFETLGDMARSLAEPDRKSVLTLLDQARRSAGELQQESWVQWVITNRCCHFYGEVLERIAQGGKKAPTYHAVDTNRRSGGGGALIDASA